MKSFDLVDIAKSIPGGKVTGQAFFSDVSTDTRSIGPGDLFVALVGPNFDGHEFIAQAQSAGACAAMVSTEIDTDLPLIVVPDTRTALGQLGLIKRQSLDGQVVAVTGSSGKTTVKEMLQKVLFQAGQVEATVGNFNNDIGVPLTLWGMREGVDYRVLELGANHVGEIAYTSRIALADVAILNNAHEAHLSGFGGLAGVVKAKGEIISGLSETGQVVLNLDDPSFDTWFEIASQRRVWSFSLTNEKASVYASSIKVSANGSEFVLHLGQQQRSVALQLLGKHNVANALAAAAAALALGLSLDQVVKGLNQVRPYQGRLVSYSLTPNSCVIDDTYNANPGSVKAAIDVLQNQPSKRCFILGDLAELGSEEVQIHQRIGTQIAAAGIEFFFGLGPLSASAVESFVEEGGACGEAFQNKEALFERFEKLPNDHLNYLVKGSRSSHMEDVVKTLTKGGN